MRSLTRFSLAIVLLALLCGCDGRGGSSGLDVSSENAIIGRALEQQSCLDFEDLRICPAGEDEGAPTPTPGGSSPSVETSLGTAESIQCVQLAPGAACMASLTFIPRAFPSGTAFRILVRTVGPDGPWMVGADPVPLGSDPESGFDAPLRLTAPGGGPPARVQIAVLAFDGTPPSVLTQFQLLAQTNAAFAFVTPMLDVAAVIGNGAPSACTEAALRAALPGGNVTFDCGPDPVTIAITHIVDVTTSVRIDGGGLVTFSGGDSDTLQMFYVHA